MVFANPKKNSQKSLLIELCREKRFSISKNLCKAKKIDCTHGNFPKQKKIKLITRYANDFNDPFLSQENFSNIFVKKSSAKKEKKLIWNAANFFPF